ncbi:PREDICTED: ribonuclease 2-like isoform X1 [Nelumbo nucifera]|uniref:Ribonuclease 2-like isoform X1 n=1 Tax=Nelumbo nucifera TaxID=4432 RepID=A0A1U7Z6J1_NELNU|nr:PREDICTED: ribonuclease 2-like isoform X1 [Nelumbo nucifera]
MAWYSLSEDAALLFVKRMLQKVSSLVGTLEKYWPSLTCDAFSTCEGGKGLFWAHEWEKHGTCSFPVIQDEYSYFITTLNLYFKYNVTKVLSEAGYVPSSSQKYPLEGVVSAIENAVGASPLLVCSDGAVEELHICFSKNLKPRNCITDSRSTCPQHITFPGPVPLRSENCITEVTELSENET